MTWIEQRAANERAGRAKRAHIEHMIRKGQEDARQAEADELAAMQAFWAGVTPIRGSVAWSRITAPRGESDDGESTEDE